MGRPRKDRETTKEMPESDRKRTEAIARFEERERRIGNMDNYNTKLSVDKSLLQELHPGYEFRWVRDQGARTAQHYNKGWDFVPYDPRIGVGDPVPGGGNTDLGDKISVIAGKDSSKDEGAYRLVLMMIPVELWKRRQEQKQKDNDEIDEMVNRHLEGKGDGAIVENSYKPGRVIA